MAKLAIIVCFLFHKIQIDQFAWYAFCQFDKLLIILSNNWLLNNSVSIKSNYCEKDQNLADWQWKNSSKKMYQYIFVKCTYLTETSKLREYSCRLRFEWLVLEHDVLIGLLCPRSPIIGSSKYFFKCFENFIKVKWIFQKYCTKLTSTLSSLRFSSFLENVRTKAKTWPEFVPAHSVGDVVTSEKMWKKRSFSLINKNLF